MRKQIAGMDVQVEMKSRGWEHRPLHPCSVSLKQGEGLGGKGGMEEQDRNV